MTLDSDYGSRAKVTFRRDAVVAGSRCVAAFEVEYQEFGPGRRDWGPWSSLPGCVHVLGGSNDVGNREFHCHKTLRDSDCAKR